MNKAEQSDCSEVLNHVIACLWFLVGSLTMSASEYLNWPKGKLLLDQTTTEVCQTGCKIQEGKQSAIRTLGSGLQMQASVSADRTESRQ